MAGQSDNPTIHLEYIYRMANKVISGDPTQPFSLMPDLLRSGNPQPIANSQSAVELLLTEAGLVGDTGMVDKASVRQRLRLPIDHQE